MCSANFLRVFLVGDKVAAAWWAACRLRTPHGTMPIKPFILFEWANLVCKIKLVHTTFDWMKPFSKLPVPLWLTRLCTSSAKRSHYYSCTLWNMNYKPNAFMSAIFLRKRATKKLGDNNKTSASPNWIIIIIWCSAWRFGFWAHIVIVVDVCACCVADCADVITSGKRTLHMLSALCETAIKDSLGI